jgi:hypothetical protein
LPPCDVFVYHIKPMFYDETIMDLAALDGRACVLHDGEVHLL